MKVEKRNGRVVDFDDTKIESAIRRAFEAEGVDTKPVKELTVYVVQTIEKQGHKTIHIESIQDIVEDTLMLHGFTEVGKRYIKYREKRHMARRLLRQVGVIDDLKIGPNAATVLKRYMLKDDDGNPVETPSQIFRRVARAVASVEKLYDGNESVKEYEDMFFSIMASLEFMPNSPTLFNAGTDLGQLSACFVLPVEDDMDSIFTSLKDMAIVQKSGGGTGFSFSRLRSKGSRVGSTGGIASGPVSFMRAYDTATDVIKQGGRRRGANMAILRCNHPDILEFIACKADKRSFRNFNISVAVTKEFMDAVASDSEIPLVDPKTGDTGKKINARMVFDSIVHNAWSTGDPGIIFIDRVNELHPLKGELIESTNPCVAGDTLVSTENGLMNIQNVPNTIRTARKLLFLLKTREGYQIKVTEDHRILTQNGWKEARLLKPGEEICLQKNPGGFGTTGNLRIGQILGWYVGDGWSTGNDGRVTLAFYHRDKGVLVDYYLDVVNTELKSDISIVTSMRRDDIRSRGLLELVRKWNLESKVISLDLLSSSKECQKGFLQGLFSADGSVQGRKEKGFTVRLAQSNLDLLHKVQIMLLNFGIASKIYPKRRPAGKRLMPDGRGGSKYYHTKANHELVISKENLIRFRDEIGFLLEYKRTHLDEGLASLSARGPYKERFLARFESLTPLQEEDVFDIIGTPLGGYVGNGLVVHNCGEQPLLPYESCVLGSVNLSKMVIDGDVNWSRLEEVVDTGVRFLDNIIDLNTYPIKEIEIGTKATRKIGLGIMGFTELLVQLGIPYDSEEALKKAEEVMSFINKRAIRTSSELAKIRGNFEKSDQLKKSTKWRRNATVTTIAPTGSISLIAQTSSGIEPLFAIVHSRVMAEGIRLTETNRYFLETAEQRGFWNDEVEEELATTGSVQSIDVVPEDVKQLFKTAHEIEPEWHVRMQAAFQKHTENAVSKTVNLPNSASIEDVKKIFLLADELQLKGITVFRDGCLEGVQVLYGGCPTCEV
jgi:ribonucleoside-diphosphate reductase alpha chain